jgi:hypothetical protein
MTKFEQAVLEACKTFLLVYGASNTTEGTPATKNQTNAPLNSTEPKIEAGIPYCPKHDTACKPGKEEYGGGYYCPVKRSDGKYCGFTWGKKPRKE